MLSFLIRFSETGAHTREINYVGNKEGYFDGKYISLISIKGQRAQQAKVWDYDKYLC